VSLGLAELQARIARAVLSADTEAVAGLFVGGAEPHKRFAIHQNHYAATLTAALRDKFPATAWLIGRERFAGAAVQYVHAEPPCRPCIAEYGATFPAFLASRAHLRELPYLESFAALEWAAGRASIAIELPPLTWRAVVQLGTAALLDARLKIQPGVRYLRAEWAIDELFKVHLTGQEIERFLLPRNETHIEVRGARGLLRVERIEPATFVFRSALAAGRSINDAATGALEHDAAFDAGAALRGLVATGLVADMRPAANGEKV
jgi:hypothetical protein